MWLRTVLLAVVAVCVGGCQCGAPVSGIAPSLSASPKLAFGPVRVGAQVERAVTLTSRTQATVTVGEVRVEGSGASAFTVVSKPDIVEPLGEAEVVVRFSPDDAVSLSARLIVASDDPENPTSQVALSGQGAWPELAVRPRCEASANCTAQVEAEPPAIDFGAEPLLRQTPLAVTALPALEVSNDGLVDVVVSALRLEGPDAAAFTPEGQLATGGQRLAPGEGFNVPVRFVPTDAAQGDYAAALVVESDAHAGPAQVSLTGRLRANAPPTVCANLVRVVPPSATMPPREYGSAQAWDAVQTPPAGGYDFSGTRDVRPGDLVLLSASAPSGEGPTCSFDPEDGRVGLTYAWRVLSSPAGSAPPTLSGAGTDTAQLRPVATGLYELELTVADAQGSSTSVQLRFAVAIKQDLVVQLEWPGTPGVDLDLHLVRPSSADGGVFSGVFDAFEGGASGRTAGDINGYAVTVQRAMPAAAFDFDWGLAGTSDDPRLNVDDTGAGALLENVSLDFPENDEACATASCRYKVLVHAFADGRTLTPPACTIDGTACRDGDACDCAGDARCVADEAPIGDAGVGHGACVPPAHPVVRIFFHGSPTPAAEIPLASLTPPDALAVGAPCLMWYAADVVWPARSSIGTLADGGTPAPTVEARGADASGRITAPLVSRFGYRAPGAARCSPDITVDGTAWYAEQPR